MTHTILVFVTFGLGHGVYRKLYTLTGGQRAEKFENHWFKSKKKRTKFGFILSETLDSENGYEPHTDIHYKSLLFWGGSVTVKVTNFHPPVKTLVRNSCMKLNSILYKSQNREANEGSVHCADIEGIDVQPVSANSFGCQTPGEFPDISPSPERVELFRSNYLTNTGAFGLTSTTDITSI